jgi:hypothetical protein
MLTGYGLQSSLDIFDHKYLTLVKENPDVGYDFLLLPQDSRG